MAALLFHGAITFDSNILAWTPVFISATLMMAVNVAPKLAQALETISRRLHITISIGDLYGIQRQPDLEQGLGEFIGHGAAPTGPHDFPIPYQDQYLDSEENQSSGSSSGSIDLNSVAQTTSSIRDLERRIDGNSGHNSRAPANQIGSRAGTPQKSFTVESPPFPANRIGEDSPPVCSAITMSSSRRAENSEEDFR